VIKLKIVRNPRKHDYSFLEGEKEFWEHVIETTKDATEICLECLRFEQSHDYMEEVFYMRPQSKKGYPEICLQIDALSKAVKLEQFSYSEFAVDEFLLTSKGKERVFTDSLTAKKKQEQHDKEMHDYWNARIALAKKLGVI